ncbi:MAG: LacI family DNA-binding transcriptional regulator [Actinomycetota bacterium]|nr:LacI family DNA-binding transcriptional regulator [Actinomycetota bacterium]
MGDPPISNTPATIDDVAREAGVSTATVSRALRNHPYVAESTRERVRVAAERLRYVTNSNASRLASGQSRTIGLLAPLLTSWYTSEVVAGVEEVLAQARYDLLIGTANALARERMFRGDASFHQRIDGIVLVDVFCSEAGAKQLAALDTPSVVLGEQLQSVTSVSVDNARGARLAARHLIELGHRRIGMVGGHAHLDVAHNVPTERAAGFSAALTAAGIRIPEQYIEDGDFTIEGGRQALLTMMRLPRPPTAVFLMSDEMAFGAMQALREMGLAVGHDVSIIGFDDHPVSGAVGLTTVRQPVRDIGRLGARLMLDELDGFGSLMHHPIELTLVVRETTGAPSSI